MLLLKVGQRMALEAAGLRAAKHVEAAPLRRGQRVEIPGGVAVKRRVVADQRPLEGGNCAGDVGNRDPVANACSNIC